MHNTPVKLNKKQAAWLLALASLATSAPAADGTWVNTGSTGALWSNVDNWQFSSVPGSTSGTTSPDYATFNSAVGTYGTVALPIQIDSGRNLAGIRFTATPGNYVIGSSGGEALVLSNGGSITLLNTVTSTTTAVRIDAPLQMVTGAYSLTNNSVQVGNSLTFNGAISALGSGSHTLTLGNIVQFGVTSTANNNNNTINGAISNGSASEFNLVKTGLANWTLTADNTYTGTTTIRGGVSNTNQQMGNLRLSGAAGRLSGTSAVTVAGLGTLINGDATAANNNGVTNRVKPEATLTLGAPAYGGGVYTQVAPATGTHAQNFASLAADVGANALNNSGTTGANTVTFTGTNGYTRTKGAFVNFGSAAGFAVRFSTAPSGAVVSGSGADAILVGSALASANFVAAPAANAPIAAATYVVTPTWTADKNMDVSGSPSLDTNLTANSLRFNAAAVQTLTIGSGFTLNLASGGLLNGSGKGANATTITGGTITGSPSGELSVAHYGSGTLSINSNIADNGGATALTRVGSGTVVLAGTNTYSGGTYLNQGTLQIRTGSALGSGAVRIQGQSSQLAFNNTLSATGFTVPNDIVVNYAAGVGSNGLLQTSAGTFVLTGTLTVNSLPVNGGLFGGSGVAELAGPIVAPLGFGGRASTIRISGTPTTKAASTYPSIFNNGSTIQVGAENGILTSAVLDNNLGAGGTFDLNGFNQELAGLTNSGSGGGNVHNAAGGAVKTLTLNIPTGQTFTTNAVLGGATVANQPSFALTKTGPGTQIINGVNTYSGPTNVLEGKLVVGTASPTTAAIAAGGSVTVASGATLGGTGTINSPVTLSNGATLTVGHNGLYPLTVNSLTAADTATINFGLLSGATPSVLTVTATDGLVFGNSSNAVSLTGDITSLTPGTYRLINYSGTIGGTAGFSALQANFTTGPRLSASLSQGTGTIDLVVTGDTPKWTGLLSNEWSTAVLAAPKNWQLIASPTPTDFIANDVVLFDDTATTTIVDISVDNVTTQGTTFNNSALSYTLQGSKGLAGSGTLTKTGSGSLTIANPNAQTGGFVLNGGTVTVSGAGKIGSTTSPVTLTSGTLDLGGTTQVVGAVSIANEGSAQNGTLQGTSFAVDVTSESTLAATLTGPGATLTKSGSGTLVLAASNTHSGNTTISGGTLKVGAANALLPSSNLGLASAATLDLNSRDLTVASINSSTADSFITSTGTTPGTDTLTISSATATIRSQITDDAGGNRKVKVVVGNLNSNLSVNNTANTFSGGLVLLGQPVGQTNGSRIIPLPGASVSGGVITSGPYGTGPITIGQSPTDKVQLYFDLSTTFLQLFNDLIVNTGLGTDTAGALRVEAQDVEIYSKITANQASVTFRANNNLQPVGSPTGGSATLFGQITTGENPAAGINLLGSGTNLVVKLRNESTTALNDYTGNTTIGGPTLQLAAANQIPNGTGKGNISMTGGNFDLNGFNETVNALTGTGGAIDILTAGTASTLTIGDGEASGSFSGVLRNTSGTLSLVKIGAGNQTLAGNNTYSGTTTISGGTLTVGRTGGTIPDLSNVSITDGATLDLGANNETVGDVSMTSGSIIGTGTLTAFGYQLGDGTVSAILGGTGGVTKTTAGLLTLTGANTYSGPTAVNAGTLRVSGIQNGATGITSVASGATLEGNGYLGGALSAGTGATVKPGENGTGSLHAPSAILNGATLQLDLSVGQVPESDTLDITGELNVTGATLAITVTGTPTASSYVLANYGTLVGTFAAVTGLPAGYTLDYVGSSGHNIELVKNVVVTPYAAWALAKGLTVGVNDGAADDPDGDGLTNLTEFALGTNPLAAGDRERIYGRMGVVSGSSVYTITLPVRDGAVFSGATEQVSASIDGVVYRIQGSTNLAAWTQVISEVTGADATAIQTGLPVLDTGWTYRTFRSTSAPAPATFLRAVLE